MFPDAMPPTPPPDNPRLEALMSYTPSAAVQKELDAYDNDPLAAAQSDEEAHSTAASDSDNKSTGAFSNMRTDAVREAALSVGTQAGLYVRYNVINTILDSTGRELDTAFNFKPLAILDGRVLPPVISEARNAIRVDAQGRVAYSSSTTWSMEAPAKIVTAVPDWHTYLQQHFADVDMEHDVHPLLLPRTKEERALWRKSVASGWKDGVRQANAIFSRGLFALLRDLKGMMRYHMLEKRRVVRKAHLAEGRKGVVLSNGGKTLSVDERVFRLTNSSFQTNSKKWLAIPQSPP